VTPSTSFHLFEAHALMFVPFFFFVLEPGLHDLGIRKLIPSPSAGPAMVSRVIAQNMSPFEKSGVHLDISETAVIQ
jgi:hypothetical protein